MTNENATIINQATTERAGAMRAQQVTDLNNARRAVADIQKILETVQAKLGMTDGSKGLYNSAQIQVTAENGVLRLYGSAAARRRRLCALSFPAHAQAQPVA